MKSTTITLDELLSNPKYRKFSQKELDVLINFDLKYEDFEKLEGVFSYDKAEKLRQKWNNKL